MKLFASVILSLGLADPVEDRLRNLEKKLNAVSADNEQLIGQNRHLQEELESVEDIVRAERADIDELESRVEGKKIESKTIESKSWKLTYN